MGSKISAEKMLQETTEEPRPNLISDIVAHPKGAPTVNELEYLNPSLETDTIKRHLRTLQKLGVVKELVLEPENRLQGHPYRFYSLTDSARDLFDHYGVFPREPWADLYSHVQKPEKIQTIEELPRP